MRGGAVPKSSLLPPALRHARAFCLRWRRAKRLELRKKKGREKEREASEVSKSPGSTESESCVACTLLLIFGTLCRAARRSGSRLTECSPLEQRAQLQEGVPRCRRGRGSVGGPEPWSRAAPGTGWVHDNKHLRSLLPCRLRLCLVCTGRGAVPERRGGGDRVWGWGNVPLFLLCSSCGPGEPQVQAAGLMVMAPPSAGGGPGAAVPRVAVEGPVRAKVSPKIREQNLVTPM
ncbi:uncharacterized protein LOC142359813 [Opisthocomus hoazin]|uniref:uncharacterized protein LOC142359813 n=1 Tax=Opisthocomus hoazin TaxID=30419 RepID=UPI003F52C042